ncbi:hypothetical protein OXYTRIMIC_310 [Oxytricha trifallax]|uniref:Uncharacterized protein n=1 Tax=Oxytricha trifallax TaxID=1172189 RepID=A0A073HZ53_9SPIT|nr:hypothetical protein OXYTRIMIC_310 [Oxytricha trifallax]
MKTSTEFMNKGAHFEMVNLSQHLLNDIKMIDSILEKSYINLKEFTKNSHLQISNIIKGLECKIIQSKIKSKSSNSVITTYNPEEKNQFNLIEQDQPEVLKYQRMHMPKLNQLKDQISNISSLLEQIEKQSFISANKNEVELKFDHYIKELKIPVGLRQVEKVHTYDDRFYLLENAEKTILEVVALNEIENHIQAQSLFTYRQDFTVTAMHEDRIIIDERVFNLDGVQICALDRYELITGITPLKGNLLAVGHESYGKCEIFAWNGNTYMKFRSQDAIEE